MSQMQQAITDLAQAGQRNNDKLVKHIDDMGQRLDLKITSVAQKSEISPYAMMGLIIAFLAALSAPITIIAFIGSMALNPVKQDVTSIKSDFKTEISRLDTDLQQEVRDIRVCMSKDDARERSDAEVYGMLKQRVEGLADRIDSGEEDIKQLEADQRMLILTMTRLVGPR